MADAAKKQQDTSGSSERNTVFFARAPPSAQHEELLELFQKYGAVVSLNLFRRWSSARTSKGCGIVHYKTSAAAAAAVHDLNGKVCFPYWTAAIVVEWADMDKFASLASTPTASKSKTSSTSTTCDASTKASNTDSSRDQSRSAAPGRQQALMMYDVGQQPLPDSSQRQGQPAPCILQSGAGLGLPLELQTSDPGHRRQWMMPRFRCSFDQQEAGALPASSGLLSAPGSCTVAQQRCPAVTGQQLAAGCCPGDSAQEMAGLVVVPVALNDTLLSSSSSSSSFRSISCPENLILATDMTASRGFTSGRSRQSPMLYSDRSSTQASHAYSQHLVRMMVPEDYGQHHLGPAGVRLAGNLEGNPCITSHSDAPLSSPALRAPGNLPAQATGTSCIAPVTALPGLLPPSSTVTLDQMQLLGLISWPGEAAAAQSGMARTGIAVEPVLNPSVLNPAGQSVIGGVAAGYAASTIPTGITGSVKQLPVTPTDLATLFADPVSDAQTLQAQSNSETMMIDVPDGVVGSVAGVMGAVHQISGASITLQATPAGYKLCIAGPGDKVQEALTAFRTLLHTL